jgi:superfamily I DNA and/or RNA helicase
VAPFGQDDIPQLQSVFEFPHLRNRAHFLDTQCKPVSRLYLLSLLLQLRDTDRMPVVIGNFISCHVYGDQLKTDPEHKIKSKTSCRFLHVEGSQEKKLGHSWTVRNSSPKENGYSSLVISHQNEQEITAIAKLARQYSKEGKKYKIITPYDAQRNAIEKELKSAKLHWEDTCFNVDSFQGK